MTIHKSVLLEEAVESLQLKKGAVVVDCTLGGGGHSTAILEKIGEKGTLVAFDLDEKAIEDFQFSIFNFQFPIKFQSLNDKIQKGGNIYLIHDNFANIEGILKEVGIEKVDAILADLGWSSDQMEDPERGMSFLKEGPLDMRLNREQELTAKEIVNSYSQEELEKILKIYGEERFAKNIARKILEARKTKPIETTQDLVRIIVEAIPEKFQHGKIHPATRTFQALRIEVNKEFQNLEKFIPDAIEKLNIGGRLAIISFHSGEDRIIKNIFRENAGGCICPADFPQCVCGRSPKIRIITKKPITPSAQEIEENPRARSAKLRVCERV